MPAAGSYVDPGIPGRGIGVVFTESRGGSNLTPELALASTWQIGRNPCMIAHRSNIAAQHDSEYGHSAGSGAIDRMGYGPDTFVLAAVARHVKDGPARSPEFGT